MGKSGDQVPRFPHRKGQKMKYKVEYTKSNGEKVKNQVYTTENITKILEQLETWGTKKIVITSIEEN